MKLTTHFHLVPSLRMGRPIPPHPCLNYTYRDDFTVIWKPIHRPGKFQVLPLFLQSSQIKYHKTSHTGIFRNGKTEKKKTHHDILFLTFQKCLHILDVTANGLTSVADFKCLHELQWLIAQRNCLTDMTDLTQAVSLWDHLTNLELHGNPVCSHRKYRESLITCSRKLGDYQYVTKLQYTDKTEVTRILC